MGTVVSLRLAGDFSHKVLASSPPVSIMSAIPSGTPVPIIRSSRS